MFFHISDPRICHTVVHANGWPLIWGCSLLSVDTAEMVWTSPMRRADGSVVAVRDPDAPTYTSPATDFWVDGREIHVTKHPVGVLDVGTGKLPLMIRSFQLRAARAQGVLDRLYKRGSWCLSHFPHQYHLQRAYDEGYRAFGDCA